MHHYYTLVILDTSFNKTRDFLNWMPQVLVLESKAINLMHFIDVKIRLPIGQYMSLTSSLFYLADLGWLDIGISIDSAPDFRATLSI